MKRRSVTLGLFSGLIVVCVAIDIFTHVGQFVAPVAVGRAICALRLFGALSKLVFPLDWSLYVEASCARAPDKVALSIVALMLKFSTFTLGMVVMIVNIGLREPANSPSSEEPSLPSKETDREPAIWFLVLLFSLAALCWWLFFSDRAEDLHPSILSALTEDGLLFSFFGTAVFAWFAFLVFALVPILRWLFPKGRWMRTE